MPVQSGSFDLSVIQVFPLLPIRPAGKPTYHAGTLQLLNQHHANQTLVDECNNNIRKVHAVLLLLARLRWVLHPEDDDQVQAGRGSLTRVRLLVVVDSMRICTHVTGYDPMMHHIRSDALHMMKGQQSSYVPGKQGLTMV